MKVVNDLVQKQDEDENEEEEEFNDLPQQILDAEKEIGAAEKLVQRSQKMILRDDLTVQQGAVDSLELEIYRQLDTFQSLNPTFELNSA